VCIIGVFDFILAFLTSFFAVHDLLTSFLLLHASRIMAASNRDEVFAAIGQLNPADGIGSFVDQVNALIGMLSSMSQYQCINDCETCLNNICGILETSSLSSTSNNIGNFSFQEIISGNFDVLSSVANATFIFSNCATFTGDSGGKICFIIDFDTVPIPFADTACIIEYNGVACNSCVIPNADFLAGSNCFTADCTNFDSSAMLNSCNDTGFVGPFVFLELLEAKNVSNSTFTRGSCNVPAAPITPTDSGTTSAPISVPMEAPFAAPMTEPSAKPAASVPTPETAEFPKAAPFVSPVRAPITAPFPSLPAPTATSRSSISYCIERNMLLSLGMVGYVIAAF
jgi:hypothetical protein